MLSAALALLLQASPPKAEDFARHVRALADDSMRGRDNGSPEGLRAAQYVADRFREAGLKPAGREGYFHDFVAKFSAADSREIAGRNVIGLVEGENPREFVVVAAHHDARGVVGGKIQNGADDNASGVAMVVELARAFARGRPGRSILFVSFDAEEDGLIGSREYVKSGLVDPGAVAAMFVFDLVGGDLFEWEGDRLYALGTEFSADLAERVGRLAGAARDLEVVRAGVHLIEIPVGQARSDYHAFRSRGVPFVFFSTGTPWYYHTEHDDPDVLNYGKMERAAWFIHRVIEETAAHPGRPAFRQPPAPEGDVVLMKAALEKILASAGRIRLSEAHAAQARRLLEEIAALREPDAPTLRRGMLLVFQVARAQGKR